jgi:hypothetical protein
MTDDTDTSERREVLRQGLGISSEDFSRILPRVDATAACAFTETGAVLRWSQRASVEVLIAAQDVRRLGGLEFPSMDLRFLFRGLSEEEAETFLKRFARAFQKGGG